LRPPGVHMGFTQWAKSWGSRSGPRLPVRRYLPRHRSRSIHADRSSVPRPVRGPSCGAAIFQDFPSPREGPRIAVLLAWKSVFDASDPQPPAGGVVSPSRPHDVVAPQSFVAGGTVDHRVDATHLGQQGHTHIPGFEDHGRVGALHDPVPGDGIKVESRQAVGSGVQRRLVVDLWNRDPRLRQPQLALLGPLLRAAAQTKATRPAAPKGCRVNVRVSCVAALRTAG
jgi:hypothetical protein